MTYLLAVFFVYSYGISWHLGDTETYFQRQEEQYWGRELTQWLKAFVLAKDLGLISSTHMGESPPPQAPGRHVVHRDTCRHILTYTK